MGQISSSRLDADALRQELAGFSEFGSPTEIRHLDGGIPVYVNQFWTPKQRAAHSLHEVSYRACFKPQLPRFFIERLTVAADMVHDPFMGRGTTELEAALLGRRVSGADINPLSGLLVAPRLRPPRIEQVDQRLQQLDLSYSGDLPAGFNVFFAPKTLREICALRGYLLDRERDGSIDEVDRFIRMVAINRLTGHSPGFFSVYTLPPNQATSIESQRKINRKRGQRPSYRDVRALILRKSRALLKDLNEAERERLDRLPQPELLVADAWRTPEIGSGSVALTVTSPPFLDIVNYRIDNWMRCWFAGIDGGAVGLSQISNLKGWRRMVQQTLSEQHRLLRPGGFVAFEVGEVRRGSVRLDEEVLTAAAGTGLECICVMINAQQFTKTSHLWGVANQKRGTNSNRVLILRRPS